MNTIIVQLEEVEKERDQVHTHARTHTHMDTHKTQTRLTGTEDAKTHTLEYSREGSQGQQGKLIGLITEAGKH